MEFPGKILILNKIIHHYSIKNIYIVSEEFDNLEKYINDFANLDEELAQNIHSRDTNEAIQKGLVECCGLLVVTANNSKSFFRILDWRKVF